MKQDSQFLRRKINDKFKNKHSFYKKKLFPEEINLLRQTVVRNFA